MCLQGCPPPPPSVVLLEEWLLVYGLKCLHGSGPPPALWLSPIDLFQETLEREGGRESRGGCGDKRVVLLGSRSFLSPPLSDKRLECFEPKHPSMQRFYTKDHFPLSLALRRRKVLEYVLK